MRPLTDKTNKIFDLVYYEANYEEAKEIFDSITQASEKIYSGIFFLYLPTIYGYLNDLKTYLLEIESYLENIKDPVTNFIGFFTIYFYKGNMLFGPNNFNPIQNYSEGKIQYENALNLFKENEYLLMNLDPWLYHALYLIQYLIRAIINKGTEKRLQFFEECLAKTKNIPYDGEQIFWFFCNILGAIYTYLGRFQDANEMFSVKPLKENPLIIALNMQNKAKLSYVQGNLNKSIYFAEIGLKYCNENSFGWGVSLLKTSLAMYYAEKGENEIAKQYFLDLIPLKKITLNPFHIVYSYYSLIRFLTNSYQLTNDYSNIQEAKTFFKEVKDIVSKYIDNRNDVNNNPAQASQDTQASQRENLRSSCNIGRRDSRLYFQ